MQNMFKDVLQLDHQLEDVDYTRPNFVHADMSPDDFKKAMEERKKGTLKSGPGGKGGKVTSRKQAIAIGLSEARKEGARVPKKAKKKTAKKKKKG